jgi:hypothetical protein
MDMVFLENELSQISIELTRYASSFGKDEKTFLDSIETVDAEVAEAIYPLLKRQIHLLKQLWQIKADDQGHSNLVLFSRIKSS